MRPVRNHVYAALSLLMIVSSAQADTYSVTLRQDEFSDNGHDPFILTFTNVPEPTAGGTLKVRASGDLNSSSEYLDVFAEGVYLGPLFNMNPNDDRFNNTAINDTAYQYYPSSSTATLTLSELQNMAADGSIAVTIDPSSSVNNDSSGEFVEVTITYEGNSTGACCIPSSQSCQNLDATACAEAEGTFAGNGTNCTTYVCFPHGACCLPDGGCEGDDLTPEACTLLEGTFQGDGSTCAASDCTPRGACCVNGACSIETEADCSTLEGVYHGDNTNCVDDLDGDGVIDGCDSCLNTIPGAPVDADGCPPLVPGDFDRDGDVDGEDFAAFVSCDSGPAVPYAEGCSDRDFDGDNDVDHVDYATVQKCYGGENALGDVNCAD